MGTSTISDPDENAGLNTPTEFKWDTIQRSVKDEWHEFVVNCGEVAGNEEGVIKLFVVEKIRQDSLNGIQGTVVRTEDGDMIFWESVNALRGRVQGSYWCSTGSRWVTLYDY